jgi:membrane fusion protein, multidrug efflux system
MDEESPKPSKRVDHPNPSGSPKTKRSLVKRIIVWLVILSIFAGLFVVILRQKSTPQAAAQGGGRRAMQGGTVTVMPATAKKGDIGVYQEAIGTVTPVYTSTVTSQVTGLIVAVHYTEGQTVHKGDPLVDIDPRPYEANVVQAQGTLEKDIQILGQAKMDLERYRTAWAKNAIAKQILDDQEKTVSQDEGTVKADQGQLQFDQVQLTYCHITAPFTGRVGLRLVDPGNLAQANSTTPLVVVTQEQPITVIFTVAEDALSEIQAQYRHGAALRVDAYDRTAQTKIATGKLLTIDNLIDTTTGTVKLRAIFDNNNYALFPNQFVNTRLLVNTLHNMTLIPTSAIQHNGEVAFVYVIQNGTAQVRNIKPGAADGSVTSVEGINPGDVVANSSFEKLQPNSKVAISKGSQPGTQSGTKPTTKPGATKPGATTPGASKPGASKPGPTKPGATQPTKSGNKAAP